MLGQVGLTTAEMPTASLADYIAALDKTPGLANAAALRTQAEGVLRSRIVYEGSRFDLSDKANASWWLMSSADEAAIKALLTTLGRPGWQDNTPRMMVGVSLRQRRGHWDTTPANAWGTVAARKFAAVYPATAIGGTTSLFLSGRTITKAWPLTVDLRQASFTLPATQSPLVLRQSGGAGPWASVSVRAAVPLTQPLSAGYRLTRAVTVVRARNPGRLTRGDVMRVTLTVDASAERNWVVVSDPVPPGATVIGANGGQSAMLGEDGEGEGVQPSYIERGRDAWRGYFAWVPRGRFVASYTMRLNGAGRFALPPSRVEAMYSPDIRAAVPIGRVEVGLK